MKDFWLIDPIDGTTNFLHGIPHFAISVALKSREDLSRTNIRRLIQNVGNWKDLVPNGTKNVLLRIDAKNRLEDL